MLPNHHHQQGFILGGGGGNSSILHDLLWYSGRTELAPSGLATPILTGALEASAASDKLCTANHENCPRIRLGRDSNNTLTIIYMYYVQCKL